MGAWRSLRHRLEEGASFHAPFVERATTSVGRRASPSEGYPTLHHHEWVTGIVREALGFAVGSEA